MSLFDSIVDAVMLIARGDPEVWRVTGVSLQVSVLALLLAIVVGLPTGYAVAIARRSVASIASWILHTLTALPTVVVGLTLYFAFSAAGPLGWMACCTRVPLWSWASSSSRYRSWQPSR